MFYLVAAFTFLSLILHASPTSERIVSDVSGVASSEGVASLWQNPAGLSFMAGSESALGYFYEWNNDKGRHHAGLSLALNCMDIISFSGGFNGRFVPRVAHAGSDISGIFATSLRFSDGFSMGISFLKSYYFQNSAGKDVKISFGFQARPARYLALGALWQGIHEGYFKTPILQFGAALRPINDEHTLGIDVRLMPHSSLWNDGFRVDPIFSIKSYFGGLGLGAQVEIPGIKQGWKTPSYFVNLELNWAFMGMNINSHIAPHQSLYTVGGHVRSSSVEWQSIEKPSGMWVELHIDHNGNLLKKQDLLSTLFEGQQSPLAVLSLLRRISEDDAITGVTLNFAGFLIGDGRAEEWRDALMALRLREKQVIVFLENPSERDYYIASAASKIFMNQDATLTLHRFRTELTYLHDLLEKVGVKATSIAAGSYKTAPRMWTERRPHKEEIEVAQNLVKSFYGNFIKRVGESRNISEEKLAEILDNGEITAALALHYGLIDGAIFKDEQAKALTGKDDVELPLWPSYHERSFKTVSWALPQKIVIIPIAGEIVDGRSTPSFFSSLWGPKTGALDVLDAIEDAVNDPQTRGIIVRINSVGGDALAGSKIQHALIRAQKKVPIVASMSDVAASAGYMIASGAEHIIAEPNTITGSIGVFSLYFSGEALAKKMGVYTHELSMVKNPGPTLQRAITKAEHDQAQKIVDWYYDNFIKSVAQNLELEESYVRLNAEGHVWLGHEALEKKLIHELGGFSAAVDAIKLLAEVKDEQVALEIFDPHSRQPLSLFPKLMSYFSKTPKLNLNDLRWAIGPALDVMHMESLHAKPQARLPFVINWPKTEF